MWAVKWLMWLVARPLTGGTEFDCRPIRVGLVTDKRDTETYFYPIPRFSPVPTVPLTLHILISFAGPSSRAV